MEDNNEKIKPRTCPFSILALIVESFALLTGMLDIGYAVVVLGLGGLIGIISYVRIRLSNGKLSGLTPTIVSIAIGAIPLLIIVILLVGDIFSLITD